MPGDRPDRFDTAVASGAGAVILDLEDAVSVAAKADARAAACTGSQWRASSSGSASTPAPVKVAVARAARRFAAGADVSDAHEAVVRAMAAAEVPWPAATTIDSNGAPDAAISAAVAAVERGA